MADKCIDTDHCLTPDDINRITNLLALDGQTGEVAGDEHYCCSTCDKNCIE